MKKPTVFRRALLTKLYRTGDRGILKAVVPPLTRGSKGRSPHRFRHLGGFRMPGNAYFGIEYGLNCAVCSPGQHQFLYQSPRPNKDRNWLKNDEDAALQWLQFRSGSGQLGV